MLLVGSLCAAMTIFLIMVRLRIGSSGSKKSLHSSVKRILMTHVQIVVIIIHLEVPWPQLLVDAVSRASVVVSSSGPTLSLSCLMEPERYSDFFFMAMTAAVCIPIVCVTPLNLLWWHGIAPRHKCLGCGQQIQRTRIGKTGSVVNALETTRRPWDAFWTTQVLILYLLIPSIWAVCFQNFQTVNIAGKSFLYVYPSDGELWSSQHMVFTWYVAVPGIVVYAVMVPLLALWAVRKESTRNSVSTTYRFGLLYNGYRSERWWWEIVIFVRKILLIMVVSFGGENRHQVTFALGIVMVLFHMQHQYYPYGRETPRQRRLHWLDLLSLLNILGLLWAASLFTNNFCDTASPGVCVSLAGLMIGSNVLFVLLATVNFMSLITKYYHGRMLKKMLASRRRKAAMYENPLHRFTSAVSNGSPGNRESPAPRAGMPHKECGAAPMVDVSSKSMECFFQPAACEIELASANHRCPRYNSWWLDKS